MRIKYLFNILLFFITVSEIFSQTFEEYYQERRKEFNEYVNLTEEEYQTFIRERDKEFSAYLKKNWESFQLMHGNTPGSKPKPDKIPVFIDSLHQEFKIIEFSFPYTDTVSYKPLIHKKKPTESFSFYKKKITRLSFYGESLEVEYEDIESIKIPEFYDNLIISGYWDQLNKIGFNSCISQLFNYKQSMKLNDWGYYLLVREFSKQIKNDNEFYKILIWYILLKSGYNVKLGYMDHHLMILLPFDTIVYDIPYYVINQINYYVFEAENPGEIKSYGQAYPLAEKPIAPVISQSPVFNCPAKKIINYTYNDQNYIMSININNNLIEFYNAFPLMKLENYFNSVMSFYTRESLFENLGKIIRDKTEEDAVCFLLHFTQNVFDYKTDMDQFGREKIFFPDEFLYYKYSDCDDRAVFFAYVVKELLKLNVVGLDYSDHVAVAVNFNKEVEGDSFEWQDRKYVVCDPTYINAPIGRILPKHIENKASVINVRD